MAWHRPGNKPLSEPMVVSSLMHICATRPQWDKYSLRYPQPWDQTNRTGAGSDLIINIQNVIHASINYAKHVLSRIIGLTEPICACGLVYDVTTVTDIIWYGIMDRSENVGHPIPHHQRHGLLWIQMSYIIMTYWWLGARLQKYTGVTAIHMNPASVGAGIFQEN